MAETGPYRLERGGQIDRSRPISFRFNGRTHSGYQGDSLAAALLVNGVRTVARSFKFHRPRGVFSCGIEEPNALVQLGADERTVPCARTTTTELTPELVAHSHSGWPSLSLDLGRILDLTAPLWAAGFYNKAFMWPSWHTYEGLIRRLAGFGQAPTQPDPDRYDVLNLHCDLVAVGAGVAGLRAALDAGRAGSRVVLVEQDRVVGGRAAWDGSVIEGVSAQAWIETAVQELAQLPSVTVLTRTTAVGHYDHNVLTLWESCGGSDHVGHARSTRERYWIVRTQRCVLASGAFEQPLIFSNNDRPGIMLAGAVEQYLCRYAVAVGRRVLFATNNDSAYPVAFALKRAGINVLGVVDSRTTISESIRDTSATLAIDIWLGHMPIDTQGFNSLRAVTIGRLASDGVDTTRSFHCDALAVSGGWSPTLHLFAQAGGKLAYEESSGALLPVAPHPDIEILGNASASLSIGPRTSPVGTTGRQWVDLLHDVTVADLELAVRERYTSIEHVKRYTTVGMAVDQGKTSTAASLSLVAKLRSVRAAELGHTTLRPPFTPVTLGAIAGRENGASFSPKRLLPMHEWHASHGALFHDFSGWQRPVAYIRGGETREQAVRREALAVRTHVGLFDGSPLGKIEVQGPDALEFVDRFYINNVRTLLPGRVRYGLMLRESGVIFDDGTMVALGSEHVLITTTSGNAGRVAAWLEEWHQCKWPHLQVAITPVTEQWATVTVTGPKARTVLSTLDSDVDLAPASFPHMAMRQGSLLGCPTRIYRVSFTGELSYEINVPADAGPQLWETLVSTGADHGLQPFGMDALLQLRLEKGFLHVGTDTDGTTVPADVGWGKTASNKQGDFIGKRSLFLPENVRADRLQLVGLAAPPGERFIVGSHLRVTDSVNPTDGWITSAGINTLNDQAVAMAMIRGGYQRIGSEVQVFDNARMVMSAQVVNIPFFDAAGDCMNA